MNARLHRRKELLLHYSKLLIKYAEVYSDECFVLDSIAFKLCCYTIIQLASVWAPDWIFDSFKSLCFMMKKAKMNIKMFPDVVYWN